MNPTRSRSSSDAFYPRNHRLFLSSLLVSRVSQLFLLLTSTYPISPFLGPWSSSLFIRLSCSVMLAQLAPQFVSPTPSRRQASTHTPFLHLHSRLRASSCMFARSSKFPTFFSLSSIPLCTDLFQLTRSRTLVCTCAKATKDHIESKLFIVQSHIAKGHELINYQGQLSLTRQFLSFKTKGSSSSSSLCVMKSLKNS